MIINKLSFSGFRNLKDAEIYPDSGINIICGDNAQGKTNIIEAIWLFTGAKSFRTSKDNEIVKFNCEKAQLKLDFISGGIENNAEIIIKERRMAFFGGKKLNTASGLAGNFYAFVFSPSDLMLVTAAPSVRRKFLDTAIGQLYPKYIDFLRRYTRAVMQRNNILRDCLKDASLKVLLEGFEEEIAVSGEKIIEYRRRYIEKLKKYAPDIYSGLSENSEFLEIEYVCSAKDYNLKETLNKTRHEDMLRGITSVGPHRDDIIFKINGFSAREYGSQGQKRSIALSLKLAEAEIINNITGELPVALLDDVMSELDKKRQNYILNKIKGRQVFITCCDNSNFEGLEKGKVFSVKDGEIF